MTDQEILEVIQAEMEYQNNKAKKNNWEMNKTLTEWLVLMRAEVEEGLTAYCKGGINRDSQLHEIIQVVALGFNALKNPRFDSNSKKILKYHSRIPTQETK